MSYRVESWEYRLWFLGASLALMVLAAPGTSPVLRWIVCGAILYVTRVWQIETRRELRRARRRVR